MALVKYNNNSLSSVTSAASFPAGAMTLIKTLTASSSSTLQFVNGSSDVVFDSTYPIYRFVWINIHCSQQSGDGEEFQFNLSADTGSNYNVSKTSSYFVATHGESGSGDSLVYGSSQDSTSATGSQVLSADNDADDDSSNSGELLIFNPSSTTFIKHFQSNNNYTHSNPLSINSRAGGYANTTSAIDEIKFEFSAGNIQSGTIKMYGIKDS
jgi:hypothetical protein